MSGTANQQAYGRSGYGPGFGRWPHDHYQLWALSRPVMIAATIAGFLLWWPLGVVALALAIANKRMGRMAFGCAGRRNGGEGGAWNTPWTAAMGACGGGRARGSGNSAFDEYREQTLRRLEEEQKEFTAFLERLRFARDKAEFDQFMAERRNTPTPPDRPATESAD